MFAAEQVDNPPPGTLGRVVELDSVARIAEADAYFAAVGADVVEDGDRAYYDRTVDRVHIPALSQFHTPALFDGTCVHDSSIATVEVHPRLVAAAVNLLVWARQLPPVRCAERPLKMLRLAATPSTQQGWRVSPEAQRAELALGWLASAEPRFA